MNQEPKFTASVQDGEPGSCFLAQVFSPSGEAVAQFEPTSPPSIASSYARLLADVLNTPQHTDAKALAEEIKAAQPVGREALSKAAQDVLAERRRQVEVEGWTPEHDDDHTFGELRLAAAQLCVDGTDCRVFDIDGTELVGWGIVEKHRSDRRRQLVIAGALILAEIERLDRAHGITREGV